MKLAQSERWCRGITGIEACLTNRTWNLVPKCGGLASWLQGVGGFRERLNGRPCTSLWRPRKIDTYSRTPSRPELGDTTFRLKLASQDIWSMEKARGLMGRQSYYSVWSVSDLGEAEIVSTWSNTTVKKTACQIAFPIINRHRKLKGTT